MVRQEAQSRRAEEPSRLVTQSSGRNVHVAIDGKVLVLQQCPIDQKENEINALKPFLSAVLCKGRILTTDAIQSYHTFGRAVQRAGGDVVMIIKDTTPATRADLELFFEDSEADRRTWHS